MYFLNILKPKGITSFDVIRQLRKRLKIKAIGHSGTLDPLAWGVMQVGVGKATKLLDYLESDKEYIADIKFGYTTETFDSQEEKKFIQKPCFSLCDLEKTLNSFIGKTLQIPPKYSAIKLNGQKLCNIVRKDKNIELEIKAREIEIYSIELLDFNGYDEAKIKVLCKKGTYIRSLVNDIGSYLQCGAYLNELTRTKAGCFRIEDSQELSCETFNKINPLDALNLETFELSDNEFQRIIKGNFIKTNKNCNKSKILLTKNNKLVSIANLSDNLIKPKKIFIEE